MSIIASMRAGHVCRMVRFSAVYDVVQGAKAAALCRRHLPGGPAQRCSGLAARPRLGQGPEHRRRQLRRCACSGTPRSQPGLRPAGRCERERSAPLACSGRHLYLSAVKAGLTLPLQGHCAATCCRDEKHGGSPFCLERQIGCLLTLGSIFLCLRAIMAIEQACPWMESTVNIEWWRRLCANVVKRRALWVPFVVRSARWAAC